MLSVAVFLMVYFESLISVYHTILYVFTAYFFIVCVPKLSRFLNKVSMALIFLFGSPPPQIACSGYFLFVRLHPRPRHKNTSIYQFCPKSKNGHTRIALYFLFFTLGRGFSYLSTFISKYGLTSPFCST